MHQVPRAAPVLRAGRADQEARSSRRYVLGQARSRLRRSASARAARRAGPGAHGSNRTGRVFTGDASGEFLYPALFRTGFANQATVSDVNDGLKLHDCFITAALRCAPPGNKPTPKQLQRCFPYLVREFAALNRLRVVIGLGAIGTKAAIDALKTSGYALSTEGWRFGHGAELTATKGKHVITLIASFHPSRQNTNTGRLTRPMFDAIFTRAKGILHGAPSRASV